MISPILTDIFQHLVAALLVALICIKCAELSSKSNTLRLRVIACVAFVLSLVPLGGLSLSAYVLSVNPSFSFGSAALLVILIFRSVSCCQFMGDKDLVAFSVWNVMVCLVIFLGALGFTSLDVYSLGYGFGPVFIALAVITMALVAYGSPLGYVFGGYILAHNFGLAPSGNLFDSLADGFLFIISLSVMVSFILRHRRGHCGQREGTAS